MNMRFIFGCVFLCLSSYLYADKPDFEDIEKNGRLLEQQTNAMVEKIAENGRDIDSQESERLIMERGKEVEKLSEKMDRLVEQRGMISPVENGERHSLVDKSDGDIDSPVDRVEKQGQKVDEIGALVDQIGNNIEMKGQPIIPQVQKRTTDQVGRLKMFMEQEKMAKENNTKRSSVRNMRSIKHTGCWLRKNMNVAPTGLHHVGHVTHSNSLRDQIMKINDKRTLFDTSSKVDQSDRKVIVPVGRKKLNKLMIFYYMKQKFPQFVHSIEKQIAKEESENSADDFPITKTSDEFLAKNENKIKTLMAEMLEDKEKISNNPSRHISVPNGRISIPSENNSLNISKNTSSSSNKSKAIENKFEKKTGRDLINTTFEDDELADDEGNSPSKDNTNCLPTDTKCVVKDLINVLKETYLKPKVNKEVDEDHLTGVGDPYSEIAGFYSDNRRADDSQLEAIQAVDGAGFDSFASKNSFSGDKISSGRTTKPTTNNPVEEKIKQLVDTIQKVPSYGDNNKWRQYDVDKQLKALKKVQLENSKKISNTSSEETENKIPESDDVSENDKHSSDKENEDVTGNSVGNMTALSSKKSDKKHDDVFDDDEITEKLKTLSNVITSLTSKHHTGNVDSEGSSDSLVKLAGNLINKTDSSANEGGKRKNTRLQYHSSQKSDSRNRKAKQHFDGTDDDSIQTHHDHRKTPNQWRNYHPPANYADKSDNDDVDPDDDVVDGPDGKPFIHKFFSDRPIKNLDGEEKVTSSVQHDDEPVELLPDDISDVTSQLLKQRTPIVSNLRNMNIVPGEDNLDGNTGYHGDRNLNVKRTPHLVKREKILTNRKPERRKHNLAPVYSHRKYGIIERKITRNIQNFLQTRSDPYQTIGKFPDLEASMENVKVPMVDHESPEPDNNVISKDSTSIESASNFSIPDSRIYDYNGNIHPGVPHIQKQLPSAVTEFHKFHTEENLENKENQTISRIKPITPPDDAIKVENPENQTILHIKKITPPDDAIKAAQEEFTPRIPSVGKMDEEAKAHIDFLKSIGFPLYGPTPVRQDSQDENNERMVYLAHGPGNVKNQSMAGFSKAQNYLNHMEPLSSPQSGPPKKSRQRRHLYEEDDDDDNDITDGDDVARLSYLTEKYGRHMSENINDGIRDVEEISRSIVRKVNDGVKRVTQMGDRVEAPLYDRHGNFYKIRPNDDDYDNDENDE